MRQKIESHHSQDAEGNPTGGTVTATGIQIYWQAGPLGRHSPECIPASLPGAPTPTEAQCFAPCTRRSPNGAFVEGVLAAAKDRLEFYQQGKFACAENAAAIEHIDAALEALESRTAGREAAGVEGTHAMAGSKPAPKKKAAKK